MEDNNVTEVAVLSVNFQLIERDGKPAVVIDTIIDEDYTDAQAKQLGRLIYSIHMSKLYEKHIVNLADSTKDSSAEYELFIQKVLDEIMKIEDIELKQINSSQPLIRPLKALSPRGQV